MKQMQMVVLFCVLQYKQAGHAETSAESKEIADCFNTYFTNIGSTLASKITPTEKHLTDYLHDSNSSSFFLTPIDRCWGYRSWDPIKEWY